MNIQAAKIRRATIEDYESLCGLFAKLDALHVELIPSIFCSFSGPVRPLELFRSKVTAEDKAIFVADIGDRIVGFADVQRLSSPPFPMFRPREFALVDNVFVLPEFRGTGLAQSLFNQAKIWAKDQGLVSIQLKVYNANLPAVRFYEKEGLAPVSTTYEIDL